MKILTWIWQAIAITILMTVIVFYFYQLYKPKQINPYRQANPYVYDSKYYHPPSEEELIQLLDELTDYDQSYDKEVYSSKAKFSDSGFSREFMHDQTDMIIDRIGNGDFINVKTSEGNAYCKGEVLVNFGLQRNYEQQKEKFFIRASWSIDNECRKYWWEGKNPRALQSNKASKNQSQTQ